MYCTIFKRNIFHFLHFYDRPIYLKFSKIKWAIEHWGRYAGNAVFRGIRMNTQNVGQYNMIWCIRKASHPMQANKCEHGEVELQANREMKRTRNVCCGQLDNLALYNC